MFPLDSTKLTLNFPEKKLFGGYRQLLENAFAPTHSVERTHPCLHMLLQEHGIAKMIPAYVRCHENMSTLRAPFILDQSGPGHKKTWDPGARLRVNFQICK